MHRVHLYRTAPVVLGSWLAFLFAAALIAGFYFGCYWLVARYASHYLIYFKVAAWIAIGLGLFTLLFNELLVKWSTGAKRVTCREDSPRLWDAVCRVKPWSAGPMPRIYLVRTAGMNAFAFGWGLPFLSAVAATTGLISRLDDDELEAVMAHEIGHIVNKDILVSTAMAISVMMMALTGYLLLKVGPVGSGRRRSSSSGSGGLAILVVLLVGVLLYVFGRLIGYILQLFVSRMREYAADATSAQIMGTSQPLMSALSRISADPYVTGGDMEAAFGFLCTVDPDETDLMSTHPALSKRLAALRRLES